MRGSANGHFGESARGRLKTGGAANSSGTMTHYIALIHKDADSCYGVSFPHVPGVITAGDTLDEAIAQGAEVLAFAAADWQALTGGPFPAPRTLDDLRSDPAFRAEATDAVVAAIPLGTGRLRPAAE